MNILYISASVLILMHICTTFAVRYLRSQPGASYLNPFSATISDYLQGPHGEVYGVIFYWLAVAMVLIGIAWGGVPEILLYCSAVGIVGVVVTREFFLENPTVNLAHRICAAIAFVGASTSELFYTWNTLLFAFAIAPMSFVFILHALKAKNDGFEETGAYLLIMLCFLVII